MKHLYFEEKVILSEEEVAQLGELQILQTQLKSKLEDVIPLGYICQDFIHHFTNSNFETKNSYRLRKNKKLGFGKIDYLAVSNEQTNNLIRDFTVNQEIFYTTAVITASHLPHEIYPPISKPLPMARINKTFARSNYLQKLKELTSGQFKFFNILSQFFERDEFHIDELELTRQQLIIRRKQNLLGISGKETVRK